MQVKGIGNSLTVLVDPKQPLDDLKQELRRIFDPVKHQSANAHIVLDTGDPDGSEELVRELGAFLKENYRIGTVTGPVRDLERAKAKEWLRQKEVDGGVFSRNSDVLMMTGLVRSGQKISARKHFLLMGDLNPGSEVIAGGDILILGSLRGKASAGHPDNEGALILALDFRPTQIRIGQPCGGRPAAVQGKDDRIRPCAQRRHCGRGLSEVESFRQPAVARGPVGAVFLCFMKW